MIHFLYFERHSASDFVRFQKSKCVALFYKTQLSDIGKIERIGGYEWMNEWMNEWNVWVSEWVTEKRKIETLSENMKV